MIRFVVAVCLAAAPCGWGHGDVPDRIRELTLQIRLHPAQSWLHFQRALLYAAEGKSNEAEADFVRAESLGADPALTSPGLAKVHLQSGRPSEACRILDELLRQQPDHAPARLVRARARAQAGDLDGAAADYRAAIEAIPQPDPEFYLEYAGTLNRMVPSKTEAAIRSLDDGLKRLGSKVVTLQLAALELEIQSGRFEAALQRIQAVAASAPRREIWDRRRADLLVRAGRIPEARQAYQEVLESLAALPPGIRTARATASLEAHARGALARIQPAAPSR